MVGVRVLNFESLLCLVSPREILSSFRVMLLHDKQKLLREPSRLFGTFSYCENQLVCFAMAHKLSDICLF